MLSTPGREFGVRLLWPRSSRTSAFAFTQRALFASVDGGRSFAPRSVPGGHPQRLVRSLAESADGRLLLSVAFPDSSARLYASDDDGATWMLLSTAAAGYHDLTPLPDGRLLGAGFPRGVECSADGGRTWEARCPT